MNPHSKPRPLIFTPRSPWGRLPLKHAHQSHMHASEDKKPGPKLDAYAESADEQRRLEEQKRRMDTNNVPRTLSPAGQRPGVGQTDKNGVPPTLQGQISPARAEDISYASQKFPNPPRMPKTPSELGVDPNNLPPQTAAAGPSLPNATNEQMDDQARRWGGYGKSMPEPGQEWNLPEWVKRLPSVEHSPDYKGLKGTINF